MSINSMYYNNIEIIYLDFENIVETKDKISHVERLNGLVNRMDGKVLVLVNLKGFMPGPGFMDFATNTLNERASKINKAAYIGIGDMNMKLFASYDSFNSNIVNRKIFKEKEDALNWLVDSDE